MITQNVDGLHPLSGSEAIEMHGSLFRTRCTNSKCKESKRDVENRDSPISEGLRGRGAPDAHDEPEVPLDGLPKCSECGSLTRPAVVWFGEMLDPNVLERCHAALASCDLLFVIGTAGAVYPAAGFADQVMGHGGHVVEFNLERTRLDTPAGKKGGTYLFIEGKCEETVPAVLESAIARH